MLSGDFNLMLRSILVILVMACGLVLNFHSIAAQEVPPSSPDDIPEPAPLADEHGYDLVNILLLGSDTGHPSNIGRTDVIVIVSINRTAGTISLLSLPRDLYVYIPGYRVYRINTAFGYGEQQGGAGQGGQLLIDTIRYNLGLQIDHWARVNFNGFRRLIDDLGGIEIAVDCGIQDWRLIEPGLDPTLEENWQLFTLPVGMHTFDGDLALWYARSRNTSSDFDRGRRHQAIIRALWRRIQSLGLYDQIADVWPQVLENVTTDLELEDVIQLAPLAASVDTSRLASYLLTPGHEVYSWRSPEGSSVQAIHRDNMMQLVERFLLPPTANQLIQEHARIEIINASGSADLDDVAADRLSWEGFTPIIGPAAASTRERTVIYDFSGQQKGSSRAALQTILRVPDSDVIIEPDGTSEYDFRVVIGTSYYACTYPVRPPRSDKLINP
jgi:LCP family protein required for cell wall assembly